MRAGTQPLGFSVISIKLKLIWYIRLINLLRRVKLLMASECSAAMKIQAILGRGRKTDFWDLYELLQHFSLEKIIHWHQLKFSSQMLAISIPNAITWYVDVDETEAR